MIRVNNPAGSYRTNFSGQTSTGEADLPIAKGGDGQGFGPHELIEAGLATCMVITARMYANEHDWTLEDAACQVRIEKSDAGDVAFVYSLTLPGLTTEQQRKINLLMSQCPVARTLTKAASLRCDHGE
ncbi:MAG: OsmC family protein [Pirellulaceae bacterium]|nr:OsmC family protein [Pirellulaceae bacterium]